jgi:hypothetical protein
MCYIKQNDGLVCVNVKIMSLKIFIKTTVRRRCMGKITSEKISEIFMVRNFRAITNTVRQGLSDTEGGTY